MTRRLKQSVTFVVATLVPLVAQAAEPFGSAIELLGKGVQIYTCNSTTGGFAWKLKAPEAILSDPAGNTVGQHFAGPSWQAADGSKIIGAPLVASKSPDSAAIPWLVLRVTARDGAGVFAEVAYIVRAHTVGGIAPLTGCDAAHQAAEVRVPYSATYAFFSSATR